MEYSEDGKVSSDDLTFEEIMGILQEHLEEPEVEELDFNRD